MRILAQRAAVAIAVAAAGAALAVAWLADGDRGVPPRAARLAPPGAGVARLIPSTTQVPSARQAAPDRIEIAGSERGAIASAELADRPAALVARDRRAWRLSELLPDAYTHADSVIHALTIDGKDYILRAAGRNGDDALVVRRATGELYLGWLDDVTPGRPLGDAERPAQRIERVARITVTAPAASPALPPARLTVVIDGAARHTITAESFAAAARLAIHGPRDAAAPAIDLAHAFGDGLEIAGIVADGARLTTAPPAPTARAVVLLTRRARFKFAWIDAAGQPIRDSQQRELTEISLRSAAGR
jgi:hypothetical protein